MSPALEDEESLGREELAGLWCARVASGTLTPGSRSELDLWLEDADNASAFARAMELWRQLDAVSETGEVIQLRAEALAAMRRAGRRRWQLSPPLKAIAVAVLLFVLVLPATMFWYSLPSEYGTRVGERRSVLLEDGSRLSLDADSKVSVRLRGDRRALTLVAGRAKFDVAHDPARPFTVTAGDSTVIATGTSFSVELIHGKVDVIVYEGQVAVVRHGPSSATALLAIKAHPGRFGVALAPGRELIAPELGSGGAAVMRADIQRTLGWESGQLEFVDEPLASAAERLNRYSDTKIVVADARAGSLRVNGVFNAGDSLAFVEALSQVYGVRASQSGSNIVLHGGS